MLAFAVRAVPPEPTLADLQAELEGVWRAGLRAGIWTDAEITGRIRRRWTQAARRRRQLRRRLMVESAHVTPDDPATWLATLRAAKPAEPAEPQPDPHTYAAGVRPNPPADAHADQSAAVDRPLGA